jgi:RNA recognition motif-containing protein
LKLFVGNLSYEITSTDLREFFGQVGPVLTARVIADHESGRSKGFGFVEMGDKAAAERAIEEFNGMDALGRALVVSYARSSLN